MNPRPSQPDPEPPAMGERRARWGYGYQDKAATFRILNSLRDDLRNGTRRFEGVRLADLAAGRADDFVLVWGDLVEGNSIKWAADANPLNWGDLIGASGLLRELADGYDRLRRRWSGRRIKVRLQTNRPASDQRHHAQLIPSCSVAEFANQYWTSGPDATCPPEVTDAWRKIAEHVGLLGPGLMDFVASCELALGQPDPPVTEPDSLDHMHYLKQFDDLHKAIATWLTNEPDRDFIERDYLLKAIGFQTSRSGLIQVFPEPRIPYEENRAAADRLIAMIHAAVGGYLSVIGPAGVGKSTLVQGVLSGYPFFIPYFAFLPNADGNRDRAEALTFFQDVVDRLDRLDSGRSSLGIADIAQGREALRRHMGRAHERFVERGQKTILLIDGLDHVLREPSLRERILDELPHPGDVPEGFIIILSGQPQAFLPGAVAAAVAAAAAQDDRSLQVSGLTRPEVYSLVAKIRRPTTGEDRDAIYDTSKGNPLILTYLLGLFERTEDATVERVIQMAGHYGGQLDEYYQERLSVPLRDSETRRLLALLCRAAPEIPVEWLSKWPEKIEDVYERVLAPFVRVDDGVLRFIHESLVAFLKSETRRSRLPGVDPGVAEREFHSTLAERSRGRPCIDPVGRARVVHLVKAERFDDVLEQVTSAWLRDAIREFLPSAHVRPILLSGFEAACASKNWGHVLRLILASHEIGQRNSRVDAGTLSSVFLDLDDPALALSQVRSGSRLLVDDSVALQFAGMLWRYAARRNLPGFTTEARTLYLQAKPISLTGGAEPVDTDAHDERQQCLVAWSKVAACFEPPDVIAREIGKVALTSRGGGEHQPAELRTKARLLFGALYAAINNGCDYKECRLFVDAIESLGSATWRFVALFRLAEARPSATNADELRSAHGAAEADNDIDLAYAWFLCRRGDRVQAAEIVGRLPHIRFGGLREEHRWGFSDVTYTVQLRWLQELLGVAEGPVPGVADDREEARARIERAARELGRLRALATQGRISSAPGVLFRSLLLFHNQLVTFETVRIQEAYVLSTSKGEIYEEVGAAAKALGRSALGPLRDVVLDLTTGPAGSQFTPHHRRYFARLFYDEGTMSRAEAIALGLSSTADAADEDPGDRQEACLQIAVFLHHVGDDEGAQRWKGRASEVSAGAGSHKDYHMASLAEWLGRSITRADPSDLRVLDRFARAIEVAGGSGESEAAVKELKLLLRLDPFRAWRLTLELVDRGVLYVWGALDALVTGGAAAGACPELLEAIYGELYSLIAPGDTSAAALAVLRAFPGNKRAEIAHRLMSYVRTNALPSHRVEVGRALAAAVRDEGLAPLALTENLKPGRDDSSQELYRLASGEIETVDQIARRLSDPAQPETWDVNPPDNSDFDWWKAIKKAKVKGRAHLEMLVGRFPPPDYREVELLARTVEVLLESGDRNAAREMAARAVARARDGSWHRWFDGAQKAVALGALKRVDHSDGLRRARDEFSRDLAAGKLSTPDLLSEIGEILDLLEIEWPGDAGLTAIDDYLEQVLSASSQVPPYDALTTPAPSYSVDQALCRFVADFVAFPAVDIGLSARRALAQYLMSDGRGFVALFSEEPWWNPIQLENLLVAIHVGSVGVSPKIARLRAWIEDLNRSESLAVRSIAKRICAEQGWVWRDITTDCPPPIILLPADPSSAEEADMLIGGDVTIAWGLHQVLMQPLERAGLDVHEMRSEFARVYRVLQGKYPWVDDERLRGWMNRLLFGGVWLRQRAIVGREAAMRVFGRRSLCGQVPPGAEVAYDHLRPIYDRWVELSRPVERPQELQALDWRLGRAEERAWYDGGRANSWSDYPDLVQGAVVVGERTLLVRPEWERPQEERRRGLVAGGRCGPSEWSILESACELTYEMYLRGEGQQNWQLIVLNSSLQLAGPCYRWAAINSNFARALGWRPSEDVPFQWVDHAGSVMVWSTYWRDGWVSIERPRLESLGEGWFVSATPPAVDAIRGLAPEPTVHLWVERHSYGDRAYEGKWHLSKSL